MIDELLKLWNLKYAFRIGLVLHIWISCQSKEILLNRDLSLDFLFLLFKFDLPSPCQHFSILLLAQHLIVEFKLADFNASLLRRSAIRQFVFFLPTHFLEHVGNTAVHLGLGVGLSCFRSCWVVKSVCGHWFSCFCMQFFCIDQYEILFSRLIKSFFWMNLGQCGR